jgi:hypothetical protein
VQPGGHCVACGLQLGLAGAAKLEDELPTHEAGTEVQAEQVSEAGTIRLSFAVVATPSEKAGDHIGRYKLLQKIGEGGCAVVYMAEQEKPVQRRVALKPRELACKSSVSQGERKNPRDMGPKPNRSLGTEHVYLASDVGERESDLEDRLLPDGLKNPTDVVSVGGR